MKIRLHPVAGLAIFFFAYVLLGLVGAIGYLLWMDRIGHLLGWVLGPVLFGAVLCGLVMGLKRLLHIVQDVVSVVLVTVGTLLVFYFAWAMFSALWVGRNFIYDELHMLGNLGRVLSLTGEVVAGHLRNPPNFAEELRVINYFGTFYVMEEVVTGPLLWAAWLIEALVVVGMPIIIATQSAGVLLPELNTWAEAQVLDYGFVPFEDHELARLTQGDIQVVLNKPQDIQGASYINAVAPCLVKGAPTGYLAVFDATWNASGTVDRGRLIIVAYVGRERMKLLLNGLGE